MLNKPTEVPCSRLGVEFGSMTVPCDGTPQDILEGALSQEHIVVSRSYKSDFTPMRTIGVLTPEQLDQLSIESDLEPEFKKQLSDMVLNLVINGEQTSGAESATAKTGNFNPIPKEL